MEDLGTLGGTDSSAWAISSEGMVVGQFTLALATNRAFRWIDGVMEDLNTLIPEGSGWTLENAQAINDYGQIAGWGIINRGGRIERHAYVLTPVEPPEPSLP